MSIQVSIGTESIRNYKRLSYEVWYALAEFIDNSTQSYFNNKVELDAANEDVGKKLEVRVVYDRETSTIRITDNAMGMSYDELNAALQIAVPPTITTGRSEFGLGLKTAACWLGNYWVIRTKKLGEPYEYEVHFDVEKVASGLTALEPKQTAKPADKHYTVVEVRSMHQRLAGRTIGKTKEFLRSMYRIDVRDGVLDLLWDQEPLEYDDSLDILTASDGSEYKKEFDVTIGGRSVSGWVAVLNSGGRPKAGFAVIRRGRVIQGQPSAWRPGSIFGQEQGSNNLVNQRIIGEVHLDSFAVSHTKNAILWQGDEESEIEDALKAEAADYMYQATKLRKRGKGGGPAGPAQVDIDTAIDELRSEMETPEFLDLVDIADVPPESVVKATMEPVIRSAKGKAPNLNVKIGTHNVLIYLSQETSPNDPYFASEYAKDVIVIVNTNHPYWQSEITGADAVLDYLRHCVYDALAEWKCTQRIGEMQPDTVKILKDGFLRLPIQIDPN